MLKLASAFFVAAALLAQPDPSLADQVRSAEIAFAKTMADRDHAAFAAFLDDEAIFSSPARVLRGAKEVAAGWKRFFEGPQAPFSWTPSKVEVLASGALALSSGPVRDASGKQIGVFNSIWRRAPGGRWKVVIDHGCPPCDCAARN